MTDAGIPMGEVLKPCPFCGSPAWEDEELGVYSIGCYADRCLLLGFSTDNSRERQKVVTAWNTRAFAGTPPPAAAGDRSLAVDRALVLAMEDFLNEPRRGGPYPEPMDTREYRAQAYYVWTPLCHAILALRTPEPNSGGEASDA